MEWLGKVKRESIEERKKRKKKENNNNNNNKIIYKIIKINNYMMSGQKNKM